MSDNFKIELANINMDRRVLLAAATGAAMLSGTPTLASETPPAKHVEPPQSPQKEGVAQLGDVKIAYWDTGGTGESVLFVHPATGSRLMWGYQQPAFAKAGFRTIGYSKRGYNGSHPVRGDRDADNNDISALMDFLGVDKFHLVGSAGGGITGTAYAVAVPNRVLSLTIASSVVGVQEPDYELMSSRLAAKGFNEMPPDFREISPNYRASNPEGVARWIELEHLSRLGASPAPRPSDNTNVTWATLEGLRLPVLMLTGDADLYAPPVLVRLVASHLKDVEVHVVDEAGHSVYWEQPETFNRLVIDFIRRHKRAS